MDGERGPALSHRLLSLAEKFRDKLYRDRYVAAHNREVLAKQMRNFRGDLSQAEYAAKLGKQKTVVGRLENPAYAGWSLRTMLEVARKENVAVLVRFVDFPMFLKFTNDFSDGALRPAPYNTEVVNMAAQEAVTSMVWQPLSSSFNYGQLGNMITGTAFGAVGIVLPPMGGRDWSGATSSAASPILIDNYQSRGNMIVVGTRADGNVTVNTTAGLVLFGTAANQSEGYQIGGISNVG